MHHDRRALVIKSLPTGWIKSTTPPSNLTTVGLARETKLHDYPSYTVPVLYYTTLQSTWLLKCGFVPIVQNRICKSTILVLRIVEMGPDSSSVSVVLKSHDFTARASWMCECDKQDLKIYTQVPRELSTMLFWRHNILWLVVALLGSFTWIRCVSKVSNLFEPLVD